LRPHTLVGSGRVLEASYTAPSKKLLLQRVRDHKAGKLKERPLPKKSVEEQQQVSEKDDSELEEEEESDELIGQFDRGGEYRKREE